MQVDAETQTTQMVPGNPRLRFAVLNLFLQQYILFSNTLKAGY